MRKIYETAVILIGTLDGGDLYILSCVLRRTHMSRKAKHKPMIGKRETVRNRVFRLRRAAREEISGRMALKLADFV